MHVHDEASGANIELHGLSMAVVQGVDELKAAPVMATDLFFQPGAGGTCSPGTTVIDRIYHIDCDTRL